MKTPLHRLGCMAAALLISLTFSTTGQGLSFDFESTPATYTSPGQTLRPGALSSLVLSDSGLTMTILRQNGERFDIVENSSGNQTGKPASWGNRSLDPFFSYDQAGGNNLNGFIANFSQSLSLFSLQFGDFAANEVDSLSLTAWSGLSGTGSLLGTVTIDQTVSFPGFDTATILGSGIMSVTWFSTSTANFPNSVFYDNFTARVDQAAGVPEGGATALLLGFGFAGLMIGRRFVVRRSSAI